jgi:hypothetical protein
VLAKYPSASKRNQYSIIIAQIIIHDIESAERGSARLQIITMDKSRTDTEDLVDIEEWTYIRFDGHFMCIKKS